ncbi:MAG: peptidyl-prolyl cis-trans isomerase, partial [Methyloceanibacter sp.]
MQTANKKVSSVILDTLRKGAGRAFGMVLMGMLVISFAIWGIADIFRGYGSQTLIKVGNTEITPQEYSRAQRDVLRVMSSDAGRSLSLQEAREAGLENRVLERLIGGAAVDTHAKSLRLGISDEALLQGIMKDPALQDSTGNFNPLALQQALRNMDMSEQGYLASERERNLRRQLLSTVGRTPIASQVFLNALNNYNNETRSLRYVIIRATAAGTVPEPTDEDLKRFYDNHQAKFTQPEFRKFGVLAVTPESVKDKVQITDDDLTAAFDKDKDKLGTPERRRVQQIAFPDKAAADAAYQKIQSGTGFVDLAKAQGVNENDLDLGMLKRSDMADAAIGDAAFKLEKDKVSEPVTGALGKTVLLRVTEIQPGKIVTFEEAKPELENKLLKDRAQGAIFDLHDRIEDERAAGTQLSEVADKFKLSYQVFDQVDRQGKTPDGKVVDLPQKTDLLNAVFATEVGVENDPLDAKDEGLIWYEVVGITPQQLKPFDQVRDEVKKDWSLDEQRTRLAKYTEDLVKQLSGGKTLEDLAKDMNTQVTSTEPLKRDGLTINVLPVAVTQAFALPQGGYGSAPSGVDEGRIVFQVDKVAPPPALEGPSLEGVRRQIKNFIGEDIVGEYFSALEARYGVTINRQA